MKNLPHYKWWHHPLPLLPCFIPALIPTLEAQRGSQQFVLVDLII